MRARNIKPGFFKNDLLAECDPLARILFEGLWCMADREGRLEYRPKKIKVEVLPYDNCNIDKLIGQLSAKGFVLPYSVNGDNYLFISNFVKHQHCHVREPDSIIPAPCQHHASTMLERPLIESPIPHTESPILNSASPDAQHKKRQHLDAVYLFDEEYESLTKKYGKELSEKAIEILNNYKMSSGKKYKSDYHALIQWPIEKARGGDNGIRPGTQSGSRTSIGKAQSDGEPYPVDFEG